MSEENKQGESKEPKESNKALVQFMNDMKDKMDSLTKRQGELETENAELKKAQADGFRKMIQNTTLGRQAKGELYKPANKTPIVLKDEPAYKGLDWKHDACPLCNETGTKNICDQTPQGSRYQCRVCAKSWSPWMLGMKYDRDLEGIVTKQDYENAKFANSPQGRALDR